MPNSYTFLSTQRLLIKPFERLKFILFFLLSTTLSQILGHFVFDQQVSKIFCEQSHVQCGIVAGSIVGVFYGSFQWLVIRRYISDWKWILVVGLSTTFMATIQTALNMWVVPLFYNTDNQFSEQEILFGGAVYFFFLIGVIFISGYLQWYILRPYITKARWWIFIPFIAILVGGITLCLVFSTHGFLVFNVDIITLTILPATQAIGFCLLKNKSVNDHPILQSPLALSNDIVNYQDIQRLKKILCMSLDRIWKTELETSTGQLTYLVGISRLGNSIVYEPMNQASTENVDQTPLPEFATDSGCTVLKSGDLTSFAKFQVVFTPPGLIEVYSWRGVPLLWFGVAIYAGIIGASVLCALLQIDILPFGR